MCGIGGAWIKTISSDVTKDIEKLIQFSRLRGEDSIGIYIIRPDNTKIEYHSFEYLEKEVSDFIRKVVRGDQIMWCCRALSVTERQDVFQPVYTDNLTAVHNGVVSNDKELTSEYGIVNKSGIDSEVVLHLIERFGVVEALKKCAGGFAYALTDSQHLILIRDFKALAVGTKEDNLFYVSEEKWLRALKITPLEFEPYTILTINKKIELTYKELITKKVSYLPEVNPKKVVVCASGGIDSTTAAYILKDVGYEVFLVHFQYGQKAGLGELNAVTTISKDLDTPLKVIDMSWIGKLGASALTDKNIEHPGSDRQVVKSTAMWVPSRNLVFISALFSVAEAIGAKYVSAGWSLEEESQFPDNSLEFLRAMNMASDVGTISRPKLLMPLQRLMKAETILAGKEVGVPYGLVFSCDLGPTQHCGHCSACMVHHTAFLLAGVEDPTKYSNPLEFGETIKFLKPIVRKDIKRRICYEPIY